MRRSPDGTLKTVNRRIGHFTDHMSKFHILFPCKNKSAPEVAKLIEKRVLAYLGPPHIFHSDNGREFVNNLLHSLLDNWSSGNVSFVTGRPRHSQSQSFVERGNAIIEDKIAAIEREEGFDGQPTYPWASWLPRIIFNMNTQWHTTIKDMPYKLVFGQSPRGALFPDAAKQIVQEEDLQGITASKESAEPVLFTTTSDAIKEKAPQTWVVKKEKVLTWTSSPLSSPASSPPISPMHRDSPVPSPPACLKQPEAPRTLAHVSPTSSTSSSSSGLPSLPSSPVIVETIITPPSTVIPAATIISAVPDHLAFESLSSREGPATFKCKEPDSPETTHESIRKKARENTVHSAIKMSSYYNKTKCTKADDFKEGDMVSFMVPKIDRCSTDLQRIPGVIHSVSGGYQVKYYKVATSAGMIKNKFRSGDLNTFSGTITPNTGKDSQRSSTTDKCSKQIHSKQVQM